MQNIKRKNHGSSGNSPYKFVFYGLRKHILILNIVFIFLWTLCNVYNDKLLSSIAGNIANDKPIQHTLKAYIILIVAWALFEWFGDMFGNINSEDVEISTRKYYVERMYKCRPNILKNYNTGYISGLVDKLSHRRNELCQMFFESIPISTVYLVSICGIMIFQYHWAYAFVIFVMTLIAVLFRIYVTKKNKPNIDELRDADAENVQLFLDAGTNINTVQKLQAIGFIHGKMLSSINRCRRAVNKWSFVNETGFCGFKFISYTILPICALIQISHPETLKDTVGFYTFLVMVQLRILHMVRSFSKVLVEWERYRSPYNKLEEILSDKNVRESLSSQIFETAEIKDCDYSYEYVDPNNKETHKTVRIQIPYFKLNKGDIICIHGESGQGKTTLLNILSGEIETDNVYINGVNTKKRLDCVFIAQDTEIFDMTIYDNLCLGNEDVTSKELIEMFDDVGLKEWLYNQPEKFNTRLGERGIFVSTGQRQRRNLIRGLIIPYGEIYLLDEPTSNVDAETEEKMIKLIKKKLEGKTAIIVTHKPKIMEICNKSYLFKNGILSTQNDKA